MTDRPHAPQVLAAPVPERDRFWYFVRERDRIRRRRESGAPEPWTQDPILRDYHFTNVHRRRDPGTQWFVALCRKRGWVDLPEVLFATYAYRSLNRLETFTKYGFPFPNQVDVADWSRHLDAARYRGEPLGSARHLAYWARLREALPILVDRLEEVSTELSTCLSGASAVRVLQRYPLYVGVFLGTQVIADLAEVSPAGLAFGRDVTVPVSGGSRYALRMIEGTLSLEERRRGAFNDRSAAGRRARDLKDDPTERAILRRLMLEQPRDLSEPLTWVDLEHCLCEYARYSRLRSGDDTRTTHLRRRS